MAYNKKSYKKEEEEEEGRRKERTEVGKGERKTICGPLKCKWN